MAKNTKRNTNPNKRWGVGPAAGSQQARVFTDRKKKASKNACRGKVQW